MPAARAATTSNEATIFTGLPPHRELFAREAVHVRDGLERLPERALVGPSRGERAALRVVDPDRDANVGEPRGIEPEAAVDRAGVEHLHHQLAIAGLEEPERAGVAR